MMAGTRLGDHQGRPSTPPIQALWLTFARVNNMLNGLTDYVQLIVSEGDTEEGLSIVMSGRRISVAITGFRTEMWHGMNQPKSSWFVLETEITWRILVVQFQWNNLSVYGAPYIVHAYIVSKLKASFEIRLACTVYNLPRENVHHALEYSTVKREGQWIAVACRNPKLNDFLSHI